VASAVPDSFDSVSCIRRSTELSLATALMVREVVFGHVVVIPGLRDKPVAHDLHSSWSVERSGGDADRSMPWRVPEEAGAALAAEAPPGSGVTVRTLEPAKATLLQKQQMRSCHRAGCRHVPVPAAALLTVTKEYAGERPSNSVANGSTQALPRCHVRRHDTFADHTSALDEQRQPLPPPVISPHAAALDACPASGFSCGSSFRSSAVRLGITSVHLQGIDNAEIIETVQARRAPMIPVSASVRL
jgi:hypothetical protein